MLVILKLVQQKMNDIVDKKISSSKRIWQRMDGDCQAVDIGIYLEWTVSVNSKISIVHFIFMQIQYAGTTYIYYGNNQDFQVFNTFTYTLPPPFYYSISIQKLYTIHIYIICVQYYCVLCTGTYNLQLVVDVWFKIKMCIQKHSSECMSQKTF